MKSQLLADHAGLRTFAVVFDTGDEPIEGLTRFAREHHIQGAQLTAIGAFSKAVVGYFDWTRKDYEQMTFAEQVEVLTLTGNVGIKASGEDRKAKDEPALHVHVVLGRRDGNACGGHLLAATVRPTLEVILIETPNYLRRRLNPDTGLALIDLST